MNQTFERNQPQFRGLNKGEIQKEQLLNLFLDAFDALRYNRLEHGVSAKPIDQEYGHNRDFWEHAASGKQFEGMCVKLSGFHLTEWLPSAPGRYFTREATKQRQAAKRYYDDFAGEYNLLGKLSMVLGGVGSLRLLAKRIESVPTHFLGASSNGISHQGIPVAVTEDVYHKVVNPIREFGGCNVDLVGTVRALPVLFDRLEFDPEIPKYCLCVDRPFAVTINRDSSTEELLVTVAITFDIGDDKPESNEAYRHIVRSKGWSFCSYDPSEGTQGLRQAAAWLDDYARRYSRRDDSLILGDFDEHINHFPNRVEFPITRIANGDIDVRRFSAYADRFGITFIKELVMGGKYNISGGQQGAVGDHAKAEHFTQTWNSIGSDIDLAKLCTELSRLREHARTLAKTAEEDAAVGAVASAETAAAQGDGPKVMEQLSKAGKWTFDVATKLGVSVAVAALKAALGL